VPWHLYAGNDLPKVNRDIRQARDPYLDRDVYTIPPIKPDFALIHGQISDRWGNVRILGQVRFDDLMAKASDKVIVSVDEVSEIAADPMQVSIPGPLVTAIAHAPYGAHPCSSPMHYLYDRGALEEYVTMSRDNRVEEYLDRYIFDCKDHNAYLNEISLERLLSLHYR